VDESTPPANASKAGALEIQKPSNIAPIAYSPGREKDQADDLGDSVRLPNLGESYKFWNSEGANPQDLLAWQPHASRPKFRISVSWGAWTTAPDAHLPDRHRWRPLEAREDQFELTSVNQRTFADGTPAVPGQKTLESILKRHQAYTG
jgi:hypothetical protein